MFLKETPCMPNPCYNGGTCQQLGSLGYTCQCTSSCSGYNCLNCLYPNPATVPTTLNYQTIRQVDPITSTLASTTTTKQANSNSDCKDFNSFFCSYYATIGYCNKNSYINGSPISVSCALSCKSCSVSPTASCKDDQSNCSFWTNNCDLLSALSPHPCPKTCNKC